MTFGFLTAGSAILAAGLVTVTAIGVSWLIRNVLGDQHTVKNRRRKFFREPGDEAADRTARRQLSRDVSSPFTLLGFSAVPSSFEEIRSAFLRESNRTHPDLNPGDDLAAQRFDSVKKAYEQIGTPELFYDYLARHPPDEVMLTFRGAVIDVLTVDEFANRFTSLRSKWKRDESKREAELASRLLGDQKVRRVSRSKPTRRSGSRREPVWIDDVVFDEVGEFPRAKYFRVFDCLLRVDQKASFYQAIRYLLSRNGFVDTFSDVKGHASSVTIIGDLPGRFIFPKPVKVSISHDDPPARLFTRLWDLGLYRGPRVQRTS